VWLDSFHFNLCDIVHCGNYCLHQGENDMVIRQSIICVTQLNMFQSLCGALYCGNYCLHGAKRSKFLRAWRLNDKNEVSLEHKRPQVSVFCKYSMQRSMDG